MSSRKSLARRTSNARASAFHSTGDYREKTDPLLPRFLRMEQKTQEAALEAALILGFESVAEMRAAEDARRTEELQLPKTAGIDRSMQYLATQLLRDRDGNHCYLCRRDMTGLKGVVEHIIPMSKGGVNEPHNVALACPDCNSRKGGNYVSFSVTSGRAEYHYPR